MISEKLQQARDFETQQMNKIPFCERPRFHVTGGVGWINDPNGFGSYKGEYHLFYQYHPYSRHWGPMHWGHMKTKDFVTWERLPIALAPDHDFDAIGCFSGSSVELPEGKQLLLYTGVSTVELEDGSRQEREQQCIAIGDGVNYEKYSGNPVIPTAMIPEGNSKVDFRDPKIWKEGEIYYAIVGSRADDGSGEILLFDSENALEWKYKGVVDSCKNRIGRMWECPDIFSLDGKKVLIISPQEMEGKGLTFHPGNGNLFVIGTTENWLNFKEEYIETIDYGTDFYAAQTLLTKDGRRILIAWLQNWDSSNYGNDDHAFFGQMTFPRELTLRNGHIYQVPVRELENYRGEKVSYEKVCIQEEQMLPKVRGRVMDLELELMPSEKTGYTFHLVLAKNEKYETVITVDTRCNTIRMNRAAGGQRGDVLSMREFPIDSLNGSVKLRLLLDMQSVELFINDGAMTATMKLMTPYDAEEICFSADVPVLMNLTKFDLEEKL